MPLVERKVQMAPSNNIGQAILTDEGLSLHPDLVVEVAGDVSPSMIYQTEDREYVDESPVWRVPVRVRFRDGIEALKVASPLAPDVSRGDAIKLVDGRCRPWASSDDGRLRSGLGLRAYGVEVVGQLQTKLVVEGLSD